MSSLHIQLQSDMKAAGLYTAKVDGDWGPASRAAFQQVRKLASVGKSPEDVKLSRLLFDYGRAYAWSAKVSDEFLRLTVAMVQALNMRMPDGVHEFMACMAFETGETFSPSIKNGAGAPYYGLIQFGDAAAKDVGTTTAELIKLTAEQQLPYVLKFFKPYAGRINTLSDLYMRILYPVAVGKPEDYVLFFEGKGKAYIQNRGLDINKDGKITKAECTTKVAEKLAKGFDPVNLRIG